MISKSIGAFGLSFLAEKGIELLSERSEGQFSSYDKLSSFLSEASRHDLLVVGLHYDLPRQIADYLSSHQPNIMLVLQADKPDNFKKLVAQGITVMINWDCPEEEVLSAMQMALKGKKFFCDRLLDQMIKTNTDSNPIGSINLTERETEVLGLIAKGKTTNEVAGELHLSNHTINSHRKNIMKKLDLKHPPQLISFAWENGLVTPA